MLDVDQIARDIIDATVDAVAPERIVLFGSRARGDAKPDSDLDLLVVSRAPFTPQRTRQSRIEADSSCPEAISSPGRCPSL